MGLASGDPEVATAADLAALIGRFPDAAVIAIDMPIGLSSTARECDIAARRFVGPRRSSVFVTPPGDVLFAPSYDEANRRSRERYGAGISRQAYALSANVRVVDDLARNDPRLIEVHPEVSFRALATTPLTAGKRTWAGSVERRRLLEGAGIAIPDDIGPAGRGAGVDDVFDAAVAAWSARRIADSTAQCLPDPPERDARGRNTAIWY